MEEGNATSDVVEGYSVGGCWRVDSGNVGDRMNVLDFLLGLSVSQAIALWGCLAVVVLFINYFLTSLNPRDEEVEEMWREAKELSQVLAMEDEDE